MDLCPDGTEKPLSSRPGEGGGASPFDVLAK